MIRIKIYDIYCDASVGNNLRGACAGALITERYGQTSQLQAVIQPTGTNNSGEICAILLGVMCAIRIKQSASEPCRFNIFSDSIIGIRGIREWIFHWIENANKNGNNTFVNSSGEPVSNQIYFKLIFNNIIMYNLEAHFYHQSGHVTKKYAEAAKHFLETNGISLMRVGVTSECISSHNNYVDMRTRDILRSYLTGQKLTMNGIEFDIIANTAYETIADNVQLPYINVIDNPPPIDQHYNFGIFEGRSIIQRYAKLIHATEYPSRNRILKYIS